MHDFAPPERLSGSAAATHRRAAPPPLTPTMASVSAQNVPGRQLWRGSCHASVKCVLRRLAVVDSRPPRGGTARGSKQFWQLQPPVR